MHHLFPPLSPAACSTLANLPRALDAVLPLNGAHRRDLPAAVAELSLQLTAERSALSRPYWASPRLTSAYLRYFLPWNIVRQARLLAALPLPTPKPRAGAQGEEIPRLLADMGSGPLTFAIALWVARPEWRTLPLTVLCLDLSPHVMELGRALFTELAGPSSPWRIVLRRGGVDTLARHVHACSAAPWLISAANVLNELKSQPSPERGDRLEDVLEQVVSVLDAPDAQALLIEPGTRLGGKTVMRLRELAAEYGLAASSPCPHTGPCPLLESRTWCHFTFDTQGAPAWLNKLSEAASLQKEALSLSFALLRPQDSLPAAGGEQARIVSAPLRVPGLRGMGRYACTAHGLALLEDAGHAPSGTLLAVNRPRQCRVDGKSGAAIIPAGSHEGSTCRQTPEPPDSSRTQQPGRPRPHGDDGEQREHPYSRRQQPRPARHSRRQRAPEQPREAPMSRREEDHAPARGLPGQKRPAARRSRKP